MLSTEEIRGSLEVTEKGRIRQSIQNCKHVLEHDPCLKGAICRNEMTCQIDIKKKVPWKRRGVQMTDTDMNNLSLYLEKNYGLTSDRVITKAVDIVANNNSFHPIIDFLEGLTWDGTPRISHMLTHFFGAEDQKYTGEIMKMHMMAAISRLYEPGTKYDIMLWSSIFVTLMANKIGGLQFGIYRNCQISSRVFHTAVAALPLTKANRSDFE